MVLFGILDPEKKYCSLVIHYLDNGSNALFLTYFVKINVSDTPVRRSFSRNAILLNTLITKNYLANVGNFIQRLSNFFTIIYPLCWDAVSWITVITTGTNVGTIAGCCWQRWDAVSWMTVITTGTNMCTLLQAAAGSAGTP